MRVGVAGITGRMGRLVADEIPRAGATLSGGLARGADAGLLARASDVVVDFTAPDTVLAHAEAMAGAGVAWVLGTTGLPPDAHAAIHAASRRIPLVWAANFSTGVTLMLALAERLAAALPAEEYDAEILEMHHRGKRDAPSGTALALGEAVAAGRGVSLAHYAVRARDGDTGPRPPGTIGFAAMRGGQVVGEHTLLFAGAAEHISVSHAALDRRVFAQGAVRAALWTAGRAPGLYGMKDVLGL